MHKCMVEIACMDYRTIPVEIFVAFAPDRYPFDVVALISIRWSNSE